MIPPSAATNGRTEIATCKQVSWGWFIEDEPIQAELTGGFHELGKVDRFADEAVGTEVVALDDVAFFVARRQNDDGQASCGGIRSYAAQHVQPVELGELEVEQDETGARS